MTYHSDWWEQDLEPSPDPGELGYYNALTDLKKAFASIGYMYGKAFAQMEVQIQQALEVYKAAAVETVKALEYLRIPPPPVPKNGPPVQPFKKRGLR